MKLIKKILFELPVAMIVFTLCCLGFTLGYIWEAFYGGFRGGMTQMNDDHRTS